MLGQPLVSVIMANRNYGTFLAQAIESAVRQTYGPVEIVVVDGGSNDCSHDIYARYGKHLRVITAPWSTLAHGLNIGIAHAGGDYLARLDPDDEWEPVKVKRQMDWFERNPNSALVHTASRHINAKGRTITIEPIVPYHRLNQLRALLRGNPVRHSSVMFNRRVIRPEHLCYDPGLPFSEDYDLWFRLFGSYAVGYIDLPLLRFRRHNSNVSIQQFDEQQVVTTQLLRHYYQEFTLEEFYPLLRRVGPPHGPRRAAIHAHCHFDFAGLLIGAGLYAEARIERERGAQLLVSQPKRPWGTLPPWAVRSHPLHPTIRLLCTVGSKSLAAARLFRRLRRRKCVLALVESPARLGLSARYRVAQYRPAFRQRGLVLRVSASWPRLDAVHRVPPWLAPYVKLLQCARRLFDAFRAPLYEAVVIQRELLPGPHLFMERVLRAFSTLLILDVDDALYAAPSWVSEPTEVRWRAEKFGQLAQMVDIVVAGNADLGSWATAHNPHVEIIPTAFPAFQDDRAQRRTNSVPIIGWIGTWGNLYYLTTLRGALKRLACQRDFELRIVCDRPRDRTLLQFDGVNVRFVRWRSRTAHKELCHFDIGLMPLTDDPWARGKCGFKILQYMAAGVPVVASPVGMNTEIVDHGSTGFLAANESEWVQHLQTLLDSPALRASFGAAGRRRIIERYSVEEQGGHLADTILAAIQQHPTPVPVPEPATRMN